MIHGRPSTFTIAERFRQAFSIRVPTFLLLELRGRGRHVMLFRQCKVPSHVTHVSWTKIEQISVPTSNFQVPTSSNVERTSISFSWSYRFTLHNPASLTKHSLGSSWTTQLHCSHGKEIQTYHITLRMGGGLPSRWLSSSGFRRRLQQRPVQSHPEAR